MHKIAIGAGLFVMALSSSAFAQAPLPPPPPPVAGQPPPAPPPPPSPGKSPQTQEAPTVAPASDPAHASAATAPGNSITEPPRAVPQQYPALGGHFGAALQLFNVQTGPGKNVRGIGEDYVNVGLTPGITLHLDDKWAIDFEFIAFNNIKPKTHSFTTLVVDPGVIRKFDGFNVGLRVATQVAAPTNSGIVPIFVMPFKVSERAVWFFEADLPLFLRDTGSQISFSATVLLQTGFGF
jgi:hypothetical protein